MSDINGKGYGSDHDWQLLTGGRGYSLYFCRTCMVRFTHYYDETHDIFEAIEKYGVPETCEKPQ